MQRRNLKNSNEDIGKVKSFEEKLSANLQERIKRYSQLRASIAKRTRMLFNMYLSQKGFSGKLGFDHDTQTLDISVSLDKLRPVEQQKSIDDPKSLSGGERSYSTVALLLSLWETMETPFKAMDEFDVFMDSVNRQISINLLIDAAKEHPNKQFIFISPQEYSAISKRSGEIKVHKMNPPDRRQATLDFSQVSASQGL